MITYLAAIAVIILWSYIRKLEVQEALAELFLLPIGTTFYILSGWTMAPYVFWKSLTGMTFVYESRSTLQEILEFTHGIACLDIRFTFFSS